MRCISTIGDKEDVLGVSVVSLTLSAGGGAWHIFIPTVKVGIYSRCTNNSSSSVAN